MPTNDYLNLLNSMGGVGNVGACVQRWHGSNFGMGSMDGMGPKNFGMDKRNAVGGVG